jgi:Holliday junction DNA helicase RuvA
MIGRLKGIVDSIVDNKVILDVMGVGYVVYCSANTISQISNSNDQVAIDVETIVREDQITLYGFASVLEKEWFLLLNKVNGVGPKVALAILSSISIDQLSFAIASKDKAAFKKVSGVGPKMAERIITELKDKASFTSSEDNIVAINTANKNDSDKNNASGKGSNKILIDASLALEGLGYNRSDAFSIVNKINSENDSLKLEDLIKEGLKRLSNIA